MTINLVKLFILKDYICNFGLGERKNKDVMKALKFQKTCTSFFFFKIIGIDNLKIHIKNNKIILLKFMVVQL